MIYGSVCSGIEAATMAWHPLGWQPAFFSEIEKFPCSVLAHHYPDVPNLGDMTKFKEWPDGRPIQLLVGGTPCQSFSVAGLRQGLDDPRGSLMLTYLAIARRHRPRWCVWENVPGVLSNNGGRDFGTFLTGLGKLGYGFAYRVLDAQYVRVDGLERAVPQRRRRVFVVGYLGDWRRAAAVLFDAESLRGNSPPRRQAGEVAPCIPARSTGGGGLGTDFDCDGGLIRIYALQGGGRTSQNSQGPGWSDDGVSYTPNRLDEHGVVIASSGQVSHCLNAGGMGRGDYETETMIAHALRGEGFDASEDETGRGTPLVPMVTDTLTSNGDAHSRFRNERVLVPVAFAQNQRGELRESEISPQLTCGGGKPGEGFPAMRQGWAVRRLTPRECERLQGFPDDFTLVPHRGKPATDGPRYKALGNSMAVNVMRWIGQRIQWVEDEFPC